MYIPYNPVALWKSYPPHDNYGILPNVHKTAILDIAYSLDSETIYSVSLSCASANHN